MPQFRKKPVVIEAVQYLGQRIHGVCCGECINQNCDDAAPHIHTLEGDLTISMNDFVIKGIQGEYYPCKPDIFAATYEEVL